MRVCTKKIGIFLLVNILFVLAFALNNQHSTVFGYIIFVGGITEVGLKFQSLKRFQYGYFEGVLIGVKYLVFAFLYLGVRYVIFDITNFSLPM